MTELTHRALLCETSCDRRFTQRALLCKLSRDRGFTQRALLCKLSRDRSSRNGHWYANQVVTEFHANQGHLCKPDGYKRNSEYKLVGHELRKGRKKETKREYGQRRGARGSSGRKLDAVPHPRQGGGAHWTRAATHAPPPLPSSPPPLPHLVAHRTTSLHHV